MKIAAILSHTNMSVPLEQNARHLLGLGFDPIVVLDNWSDDQASLETMEALAQDPRIQVYHCVIEDRDEIVDFVSRMFEGLGIADGVEWLAILDGDEVLYLDVPQVQDLPELAEADLVIIQRFNAALPRDGLDTAQMYGPNAATRTRVCIGGPSYEGQIPGFGSLDHFKTSLLFSGEPFPWKESLVSPLAPAFMARFEHLSGASMGRHYAKMQSGMDIREVVAENALIAQRPLVDAADVEAKARAIRKTVEREHPYGGNAMQWAFGWQAFARLKSQREYEICANEMLFSAEELTDLIDRGLITTASDLFRTSVLLDHHGTILSRVSAAKDRNDPEHALAILREGAENASDREAIWFPLAMELMQQGHVDEGLQYLKRLVDAYPGYSRGHVNYARALLKAGRLELALTHASIGLEMEIENRWHAVEIYADVLLKLGRGCEALPAIDRALSIYPLQPPLRLLRARILMETGEADAAWDAIEDCLAHCPKYLGAFVLKGQLLVAQGKNDTGFSTILDGLEIEAQTELDRRRAMVELRKLAPEISDISLLKRAYELGTGARWASMSLLRVLIRSGPSDEAVALAETLVNDLPDDAQLRFLYSRALRRSGAPQAANAQLDIARRLDPDLPALNRS